MKDFVTNPMRESKEDAITARSYLTQVDESLENLIKSWKVLKKLPLEEDQRDKIFVREEQLKKWVMDARIEALNLISRADPESTMDKCSDKGSESGGSDSKHLKREKMPES